MSWYCISGIRRTLLSFDSIHFPPWSTHKFLATYSLRVYSKQIKRFNLAIKSLSSCRSSTHSTGQLSASEKPRFHLQGCGIQVTGEFYIHLISIMQLLLFPLFCQLCLLGHFGGHDSSLIPFNMYIRSSLRLTFILIKSRVHPSFPFAPGMASKTGLVNK